MNTDSYFAIGKSHTVCEDYALSGENYVIVSDGCSGSPDTDFGARLLAKVCEQEILTSGLNYSEEAVIYKADAMADHIGLPRQCLDATLITACAGDDNFVDVRMFGDGAVIILDKDMLLTYHTISYKHNAPAYLSYRLDPERARLYLKKSEDGLSGGIDYGAYGETKHDFIWDHGLDCHKWRFRKDDTKLVIIASDGIESFMYPKVSGTTKKLENIGLLSVLLWLTEIKGFKGKFLERRCKRFLKEATAEGWQHNDDFSLAAIHLGD